MQSVLSLHKESIFLWSLYRKRRKLVLGIKTYSTSCYNFKVFTSLGPQCKRPAWMIQIRIILWSRIRIRIKAKNWICIKAPGFRSFKVSNGAMDADNGGVGMVEDSQHLMRSRIRPDPDTVLAKWKVGSGSAPSDTDPQHCKRQICRYI